MRARHGHAGAMITVLIDGQALTKEHRDEWRRTGLAREKMMGAAVDGLLTLVGACGFCSPAEEHLELTIGSNEPMMIEIKKPCCDERVRQITVHARLLDQLRRHELVLSRVRLGIEKTVANIHAQRGTVRSLRFIAWADPQEDMPESLLCDGCALIVSFAASVVGDIERHGVSLSPSEIEQLQTESGEYVALCATLVDGTAMLHELTFPFVAGGSA